MGFEGGHIHRVLKEKAKEILKSRGFSDEEIFSEYPVQFDEHVHFRHDVDIAGIKPNQKVAIEIGSTPKNRINNLKKIFNEVIHIPKKEYIPQDLTEIKYDDSVSKRKEYLTVAYNKYVYEIFKNDSVLEPKRYTSENEADFGLDKHKRAWLNVPSSSTMGYHEWMYRINLCLSCLDYDSFEISIGTDSKKANLQFIRLIDNEMERKRLISEFTKLDNNFFTHVYCNQGTAPPRKKLEETSIYYQTNKINDDDLYEIRKNLTYWLDFGSKDLIYPHIRIIRITKFKAEKIPEIITQIKPLISFLIDFKNKDFEQQQEFKKQLKVQSEKEKFDVQKKRALARAKECQTYQKIDKCSPEDEEKCKKCSSDWHKFL